MYTRTTIYQHNICFYEAKMKWSDLHAVTDTETLTQSIIALCKCKLEFMTTKFEITVSGPHLMTIFKGKKKYSKS